jgi:hypothetical protein
MPSGGCEYGAFTPGGGTPALYGRRDACHYIQAGHFHLDKREWDVLGIITINPLDYMFCGSEIGAGPRRWRILCGARLNCAAVGCVGLMENLP